MPNQSTEDYIKSIYKLQIKGKPVSTSVLARVLHIGDGSVTDMLKRLSIKKLIQYKPYKGVLLTGSGRRLAIRMVRRHRLWEMFLVEYLGYRWDEIHEEAERLEHVTSDELERRLDRLLGQPRVDPHGDPIPNVHGDLEGKNYAALSEFQTGDILRIIRVSDADPALLQHAAMLGLGLNKKIFIKKKMDFDGSLLVKIGTKEQFISAHVADSIFVEPV